MQKLPNNLLARVIIITGTPGTGKTTIATKLSEKINGVYLNSGKIIKNGYFLGVDIKRNSLIADIEKLQQFIDNTLRERTKQLIILDSHMVDIVSPKYVLLVVVLTTAIEELRKRLKKKGFPPRKIKENIEAELCKICAQDAIELYEREKILEVDTTSSTPREIVSFLSEEIKKRLT